MIPKTWKVSALAAVLLGLSIASVDYQPTTVSKPMLIWETK